MDGDRPSRRAHILSSINPLRGSGQTISSHKQDPPPSPGRRHRAERTDEADNEGDDDDDDDDYAPAAPGKSHSKAERQQESPQPSDRGATDSAYSSSKPTKFRFKSEKRSRSRRYSMDDPLLLGVKSRSRRSRARDSGGEGDDHAEGRSGRRERDPSQRHRQGDEHHSSSSSHHHNRSRRHGDDDDHDEGRSSKRRRREHRDKSRKNKKKKTEERGQEQEPEPEDPFAPPPLDADAAFRESLFDAMADDEGAAYWEGVYGQPIHTGKRADISEAAGARVLCAAAADVDVDAEEDGAKGSAADPRSWLKDERVRWHPDKVQQRLGGKVDEALMRDVTTVFQIVDKLWTEARAASST
ncbi:hypothetical protein MAPG_03043 [Magnaporthiopsis poae ATCC 64411]|uniref:Uncharacterized protein n=1 Tax=Magnaporthiopsis poae (strain ATCC 64411 / 73-15) TaxID=644358 RepID=A0A0C4DSZ5_MAGP6|nr:hypothetical protein MAPG_03043 [Magnaporthiopsis poae ATCC 64411]